MKMQRHSRQGTAPQRAAGLLALITAASLMTGCASRGMPPRAQVQEQLDAQIQVPPGHVVALETTAVGLMRYECRLQTASASPGWELASVHAELMERSGSPIVQYTAPPPTWTHMDGSSVTGDLLALAPRPGTTNLPYQLSRAMPAETRGALHAITYIQRIQTKGGQGMAQPCTPERAGETLILPYQADYVFWKAG